jgi:hypothetical protein
MDLSYDVFQEKIRRSQESINSLKNSIENLSKGARRLYLAEMSKDLNLLLNTTRVFSSEDKEKMLTFSFEELINDIVKDIESFE